MDDVYRSEEFSALHTLQRRLGTSRRTQGRPYEDVIKSMSSLQASPAARRWRFFRRRTRGGG